MQVNKTKLVSTRIVCQYESSHDITIPDQRCDKNFVLDNPTFHSKINHSNLLAKA